jgi:hypothetical protein
MYEGKKSAAFKDRHDPLRRNTQHPWPPPKSTRVEGVLYRPHQSQHKRLSDRRQIPAPMLIYHAFFEIASD